MTPARRGAAGADLPRVSLEEYRGPGGRVVDPVDPVAASLLPAAQARAAGVLPFAIGASSLYVAVEVPLRSEAQACLAALGGPLHLYRTEVDDLAAAQDRAYGAESAGGKPFGALAAERGWVEAAELAGALAAQAPGGGRIGSILCACNAMNFRDVARTLAEQARLPWVDLLTDPAADAPKDARAEPGLFDLMPEAFWRRHDAVPVRRWRDFLVVAVEDPRDRSWEAELAATVPARVRRVVTGRRDIQHALDDKYGGTYLAASRDALQYVRPHDSARRLLTREQGAFLLAGALVLAAAAWAAPVETLMICNVTMVVAYVLMVGWRMWIMRASSGSVLEVTATEAEVAALDDASLPVYTVLVPLRDETEVLPILTQALAEIDYPKDRLDVKLLIERDDTETLRAAKTGRLPNYVDIIAVPPSVPRTKPKACNYGLYHARGEYVVIYDAEDIPEPDQLKKALVAFSKVGPEVACIQAKLSYFNRNQNVLTRWFTAEYAMWFDLLLPGLHRAALPIPLGGTSNHLRAEVVHGVGAWDPYNVTEDADLGVRLHKAGHRTALVDSTTFEEANSDFVNWMRQRSRWVKGYIQTWLVHMRHPVRLWRELGGAGFLAFQMMIAGTPLLFLLNPLYWLITTLWFLVGWGMIPQMFPSWVYYLGMTNMLFGSFAFTYMNMAAVARRGQWDLVRYTVFAPLYWGLMSVASWKALLQLFTRPSHWEKTVHGLADLSPLFEAVGPAGTAQRRVAMAGDD